MASPPPPPPPLPDEPEEQQQPFYRFQVQFRFVRGPGFRATFRKGWWYLLPIWTATACLVVHLLLLALMSENREGSTKTAGSTGARASGAAASGVRALFSSLVTSCLGWYSPRVSHTTFPLIQRLEAIYKGYGQILSSGNFILQSPHQIHRLLPSPGPPRSSHDYHAYTTGYPGYGQDDDYPFVTSNGTSGLFPPEWDPLYNGELLTVLNWQLVRCFDDIDVEMYWYLWETLMLRSEHVAVDDWIMHVLSSASENHWHGLLRKMRGPPRYLEWAWDEWQRMRDPMQNTQGMAAVGFERVEEAYYAAKRALSRASWSLSKWHWAMHDLAVHESSTVWNLALWLWNGWGAELLERGENEAEAWAAVGEWWDHGHLEPLWVDLDPATRRTWDLWVLNRTLHKFFAWQEEEPVFEAQPAILLYTAAQHLQESLELLDTALHRFENESAVWNGAKEVVGFLHLHGYDSRHGIKARNNRGVLSWLWTSLWPDKGNATSTEQDETANRRRDWDTLKRFRNYVGMARNRIDHTIVAINSTSELWTSLAVELRQLFDGEMVIKKAERETPEVVTTTVYYSLPDLPQIIGSLAAMGSKLLYHSRHLYTYQRYLEDTFPPPG